MLPTPHASLHCFPPTHVTGADTVMAGAQVKEGTGRHTDKTVAARCYNPARREPTSGKQNPAGPAPANPRLRSRLLASRDISSRTTSPGSIPFTRHFMACCTSRIVSQ